MLENLSITRMAESLASHAATRLDLIARNVAQADTPGYKAMDLPDFAQVFDEPGTAMRATRPGHLNGAAPPLTPVAMPTRGEASPNGNTVSIEKEMVKAAVVRQDHEMALAVYRSTQDILRASLGRK